MYYQMDTRQDEMETRNGNYTLGFRDYIGIV